MKGIVLAALVVAIIAGYGCVGQSEPVTPPPGNGTDTANAITEGMCTAAGGHWNECGSACRGAPPGTACIAMCVPYCECGGIAGFRCPAGYVCGDYLPDKDTPDALGICKRVSE